MKFDNSGQYFKVCTNVEGEGTWDNISLNNLAKDCYYDASTNLDVKTKIDQIYSELRNAINVHKSSGDHDKRYYLKSEIDKFLKAKQDTSTAINIYNIGDQSVANADTVDGLHASSFQKKSSTLDDVIANWSTIKNKVNGKFLPLSGGTMTGSIKISKGGLNLQNEGITMNNCAITGVSGISGVNTPDSQAGLQIFSAIGNSATNKDIFLVCQRTRCVHYGFTGALNTYADLYCDRLHYVNPPMTDSSRLVKENITDMSNEEAEKILDVDVKDFDYIEGFGDKGQHGVIAEELEEILPNLVYTPEGYREEDFDASKGAVDNKVKSVSYVGFIPYLIKALQIQNEKIKELESKVEMLSK